MGGQITCTLPVDSNHGLTGDPEPSTQVDVVDSQQKQEKVERGAKTAENVRYGQTISEGGMGGKTNDSVGIADQGTLSRCVGSIGPLDGS